MITVQNYWMGRDVEFKKDLTDEIKKNADDLIVKVNQLLLRAKVSGIECECNPDTGTSVSSGWRPPAVNKAVPGAAIRSNHMTGKAIDLYDPEGVLDNWCMSHQGAMAEVGLWMEHPSATKGWCHLQSVPPRSGNRVFYP